MAKPGLVPPAPTTSGAPRDGELPVILIPGTGEDAYAKWAGLASRLARAGLCAYTFTDNPLVVDEGDLLGFVDRLPDLLDAVSCPHPTDPSGAAR